MVGRVSSLGFGTNAYAYSPIQASMGSSDSMSGKEAISLSPLGTPEEPKKIMPFGDEEDDKSKSVGKAEKKGECQSCKNRKYVDGSDEMVSFKAPSAISREAAPGKVRAHEQEHVNNAFAKAAEGDGKVLQASVAIKMAICPECGRSYIAGGTTTTKIAYPNDDKYSKNMKSANYDAVAGSNIDTKA